MLSTPPAFILSQDRTLMLRFFPVKKTSTFLSSLTRLLFVCTFVLLRNLLLVLHPSSLGMLRIPRSWASRGASRLGRPGSVCKSCPLSKLPVQSFHPSPGCWTLQKFQGCLYCLIFDFQGSRLISQPAQKEGFEPSRRYQRPTPFPGEPLQPLGYFCLRTNA